MTENVTENIGEGRFAIRETDHAIVDSEDEGIPPIMVDMMTIEDGSESDYMDRSGVLNFLNQQEITIKRIEMVIVGYQDRIDRQSELIKEQQEQIDEYIDIKAKLDAKIAEYDSKSKEYDDISQYCASKHNGFKRDALKDFKKEIFGE